MKDKAQGHSAAMIAGAIRERAVPIKRIVWLVAVLGALLGTITILAEVVGNSSPTRMWGAAVAVAYALVPYCLARAVSELLR